MSACRILGIPIEVGNQCEIFQKCKSLVGIGGVICTPNPLILSNAMKNPSLRRALLSADLLIPDGIGLLPSLRRASRGAAILPGVELGKMLALSRSNHLSSLRIAPQFKPCGSATMRISAGSRSQRLAQGVASDRVYSAPMLP